MADDNSAGGGQAAGDSNNQSNQQAGAGSNLKTKLSKRLEGLQFVLGSIFLPLAIAFFAAPSLIAAAVANQQSQTANQLALLSLCYGNLSIPFCKDLLAQTHLFLPKIANTLYGLSPASGGGSLEPIAPLPAESTKFITHRVSLKDSQWGLPPTVVLLIPFLALIGVTLIMGLFVTILTLRSFIRVRRQNKNKATA